MNNSQNSFDNLNMTSEKNPVLMEDVMENVFSYLQLSKLVGCRLVSKEWNLMLQSLIRRGSLCQVTLGKDQQKDRKFLEALQNHIGFLGASAITLVNWGDVVGQIHVFDGSDKEIKECLKANESQGYFQEWHGIIVEICGILGSRGVIKELSLKIMKEDNPSTNFRYILKILDLLSPSLETLRIPDSFTPTRFAYELPDEECSLSLSLPSLSVVELSHLIPHYFTPWMKLVFKSSPNLRDVFGYNAGTGTFSIIPLLHENSLLSQVRSVNVLNPHNLDILSETQKLALEEITFSYDRKEFLGENIDHYEDQIRGLLGRLTRLKKMTLSNWPEDLNTIFSVLPNLESLTLKVPLDKWQSATGINYSRWMPNLKQLTVYHLRENLIRFERYQKRGLNLNPEDFGAQLDPVRKNPVARAQMKALESLEILEIHSKTGHLYEPLYCQGLGQLFPNVRKLCLSPVSGEFLRELWKWWGNLVELDIQWKSWFENQMDVDESLFGVKNEWKDGIDRKNQKWWKYCIIPDREGENLDGLEALERLTLRGDLFTLTDFSVYFGLSVMAKLRELRIEPKHHKISREAMEYLRLHCGIVVLNASPL